MTERVGGVGGGSDSWGRTMSLEGGAWLEPAPDQGAAIWIPRDNALLLVFEGEQRPRRVLSPSSTRLFSWNPMTC